MPYTGRSRGVELEWNQPPEQWRGVEIHAVQRLLDSTNVGLQKYWTTHRGRPVRRRRTWLRQQLSRLWTRLCRLQCSAVSFQWTSARVGGRPSSVPSAAALNYFARRISHASRGELWDCQRTTHGGPVEHARSYTHPSPSSHRPGPIFVKSRYRFG